MDVLHTSFFYVISINFKRPAPARNNSIYPLNVQVCMLYLQPLLHFLKKLVITPQPLYRRILLLLRWRYSPGWALASFTIRLQASQSLALSLHSFIPIFLRSVDTSSSHLIFGLPLRLVAYSFPYNIFFGIAVSCILSM